VTDRSASEPAQTERRVRPLTARSRPLTAAPRRSAPTARPLTAPTHHPAPPPATPISTPAAPTSSLARSLAEIPALVALAVAIVVVVRFLFVQAFFIPSTSMIPQLQVQDKVVVSRLAYRLHPVHRGDIIVFPAPPGAPLESPPPHGGSVLRRSLRYIGQRLGLTSTTDEFIKRVIALPGETVGGHDGHVYINGRLLLEPYLPPGTVTPDFAPVTVPPHELWVMGDSRQNSYDSKYFGPIKQSKIVGRAFLRVWPLTHFSFL
jgi:signal peptidase I